MSYTKQNFNAGDVLKAAQLNAMDEQILANEIALEGKQPKGEYPTFSEMANAISQAQWGGGEDTEYNIIAVNHRGYSKSAPENTIPAYIMSKQKGFKYVECDVSFTKDGVAVLLHDSTIDRTSNGSGSISSMTYEQAKQYDYGSWKSANFKGTHLPTLDEFLFLCKSLGLYPYIEIKNDSGITQEMVKSVVDSVKKNGMQGGVTYISFNSTYLEYVKNIDSNARLGFVVNSVTNSVIDKVKSLSTDTNDVFVDCSYQTLTSAMVEICINADVDVEVWTVNSESWFKSMNPYIHGVTSDYIIAGKVLYNNAINYVPPVSDNIPTTSITLNTHNVQFTSYDTITLIASVTPSNSNESVVWISSDESIAKVSNGVVTPISDGSCVITVMSGDYSDTCEIEVVFTKFNIDSTLSGCQINNDRSSVVMGERWSGEIIPNEGFSLKNATIQINMGGNDITETVYNNGIITIEKVTAEVSINVVCVQVPVYTITRNLTGCTSNKNTASVGEGNPYNEVFTALEDYKMDGAIVSIMMGEIDVTSMYNNGTLSISEVTGDIIINIEAKSITVYNITRNLKNCTSNKDDATVKEGYSYTETFTPNTGYTITKTKISVTMGGYDISSLVSVNGILNIDSVDGDIIINIEAVEWEEVITLVSDDFKYRHGLTLNSPYYESRNDRVSYTDFDIIVNSGYIYKLEFEATVDTAQIGLQCLKEAAKDTINKKGSINSSLKFDPGWQNNGVEIEIPSTHNNGMARFTFRKDTNNSTVPDGMITSLRITRKKI